jgi:elongation factor 3
MADTAAGQKIKLVIAACLWNNPQVSFLIDMNFIFSWFLVQICVLDEPSNFLDREALGGLAVAIKEWSGAVVRGFVLMNLSHVADPSPNLGHHLPQP